MTLPPNQIAVWSIHWPSLPGTVRVAALGSLTEDELARLHRYRRVPDRQRFGLARGLLRLLAAAYLSRPAEALLLADRQGGKPFWRNAAELCFNVSHSGEWILLAFARQIEIGIDVQETRGSHDIASIARLSMHPDEEALLAKLSDPAERRAAFYRIWSTREAVLKATGEGVFVRRDALSILPLASDRSWRSVGKDGPVFIRELPAGEHRMAALAAMHAAPGGLRLSLHGRHDLDCTLRGARTVIAHAP